MALAKPGNAAELGAVLCRDSSTGTRENLRGWNSTGGEMKESGSQSRELETCSGNGSLGDQRAKQQNLHLRAFQTCLNSPGWSHSGNLFQK